MRAVQRAPEAPRARAARVRVTTTCLGRLARRRVQLDTFPTWLHQSVCDAAPTVQRALEDLQALVALVTWPSTCMDRLA